MVKWCKYPFEGVRSSAGVRGEWGEYDSYREYMDAVNAQLLICPMIETQEALDCIEEILAVPGIDVLLVGPSDLSININVPLDYTNPKYHATLDRIGAACADAGVTAGMYFAPPPIRPPCWWKRVSASSRYPGLTGRPKVSATACRPSADVSRVNRSLASGRLIRQGLTSADDLAHPHGLVNADVPAYTPLPRSHW